MTGLGVAVSPPLTGGTVDGRHQVGANQRVEDVLDLTAGQAERGLELAVAGPDDRPGTGLPILRRAEGEQDVDGVAQARGKTQWPGGLLERGESACPFETPSGKPPKRSASACTWTCAAVSRRHPGAIRAWVICFGPSIRDRSGAKSSPWRCLALFRLRSCREIRI